MARALPLSLKKNYLKFPMIKVSIHNPHNFTIDEKKVVRVVKETFQKNGVAEDAEASVAILKAKELKQYADYLEEPKEEVVKHPVLSFLPSEVESVFMYPPSEVAHMGEIVINFDYSKKESKETGVQLDAIICELAEHGALHLAGVHHN